MIWEFKEQWLHGYVAIWTIEKWQLNGKASDLNIVKSGIPQISVLGPTLFSLYTSDLPDAVTTGTIYMYADDTTLYCIGDSIDTVTTELNKTLEELEHWKS
jgi:hypothetical protein